MTDELPEKLSLASMDVAAEKRDELRRILADRFPEAVSENKLDLDQLKRVLGEWVEPDRERFGLNWPGKAACMKVIQAPSVGTLKPRPDESVDWDTTQNLFIEGDNLEVLKLLQKAYFGKVKMIYIDPPYNTGKEFIYPDKYSETLDTYLQYTGQSDSDGRKFSTNTDAAGRFHSRWLNMMYPRLYLARNLLRDDGVIFISIDDNEQANLKLICDQIFGQENFLACVANVNNPKGRSDDKYFAGAHEYILVYKKDEISLCGWDAEENITKRYNKISDSGRRYREIDLRKTGDSDLRKDRPNMFYSFFYDEQSGRIQTGEHDEIRDGFRKILPFREDGKEGRWRWGRDTANASLPELTARYMPNRDTWSVFEMDYLDGRDGVKPTTAWTFKDVNSERGSEQFIDLGFDKEVFPKPKPLGTLKRILHLACPPGKKSIVLDFFAGSGSLGEAVFQRNFESGSDINFILVQLPDHNEISDNAQTSGYKNIADIGKERLKRAAHRIKDKLGGAENDIGFRCFCLDQSSFKVWRRDANTLNDQTLLSELESHADQINTQASDDQILFEILLRDGFPLSTKVTRLNVHGKEVYSVADGALLVCLERELTQELMDALADKEPARVICLDIGFQANDQLKANAVQTFKARARSRETAIEFRTV